MTELSDELRHHPRRTRRPRAALLAGAAALALLTTAACSSSGNTGSSGSGGSGSGTSNDPGVAHAQQQVAQYEKATTSYPSPGGPLDAQKVAALKGKTVLFVPLGLVGPFVLSQQSVVTALTHVVITVKTCDPNFLPPRSRPASVRQRLTGRSP